MIGDFKKYIPTKEDSIERKKDKSVTPARGNRTDAVLSHHNLLPNLVRGQMTGDQSLNTTKKTFEHKD